MEDVGAIFASNFLDLEPSGVSVSATDVTAWRAQEDSPRVLAIQDPVTGLLNRRAFHRVSPASPGSEVTGNVAVENFEFAAESLSSLRQLGRRPTGLDDFGSRCSSLGYLRRLPLYFLELDRELVRGVDTGQQRHG